MLRVMWICTAIAIIGAAEIARAASARRSSRSQHLWTIRRTVMARQFHAAGDDE
jgi:hypothetical protein